MEGVLLKDVLGDNDELIYTWLYIDISSDTRLYYKPIDVEDTGGFYFTSVDLISAYGNNWGISTWEVKILYTGTAYFDGIRHMYLGSNQTDNYGYDYYSNLEVHIKILQELKKLEDKYCTS